MALLLFAVAGCMEEPTLRFPNGITDVTALKRGIATRDDVQKLFGTPDGRGSALFPADNEPGDVWFYLDSRSEPSSDMNSLSLHPYQTLIVFFAGNQLNGYLFTTNTRALLSKSVIVPARGQVRYDMPYCGSIRLAILGSSGCEAAPVGIGAEPNLAALGTLRKGVTRSAELEGRLGHRNGEGILSVPGIPLRDVWVYRALEYHERLPLEEIFSHEKTLLVFIDPSRDVFDGYMWFDSDMTPSGRPE
jgi:hypothetical protein